MIVFSKDDEKDNDDVEISGVIPGTGQKNVSFRIDDQGKLDLKTVPDEFRDLATKLWVNVMQPKYLNDANDEENMSWNVLEVIKDYWAFHE